jgi:glycerol-3-phosphate dehydrogenase
MGLLSFSIETRARDLDAMAREEVELLVIGGGITGAGVARDAALRGLRVALLERGDFASGTSSRSSKLIHSGLRYLEQGEVGLVLEAAAERRALKRIAPHLAKPARLALPVHGRTSAGLMKLRAGLWAWEKMARIEENERHEIWRRDEAIAELPGLLDAKLQGAAVYTEYITDDARLTLETVKSAKRHGALVASYAPVTAVENGGPATRAPLRIRFRDELDGGERTVSAAVVVNAAGPWVDAIRRLGGDAQPRMRLTKGIHLVVARDRLPVDEIVVMRALDRRMVFAVPLHDFVWIGTTDTETGDAVERPRILRSDVDYLLEATNRTWPRASIGDGDVLGAWAGVRPLIHQEGKAPSEISRRDEVTAEPNGMLTIAGGKLTTYRQMAERVVDMAVERLGRTAEPCRTAELPLVEGGSPIEMGRVRLSDAEVLQAVDEECALTLADVLERRARASLFARDNGRGDAERIAALLGKRLSWCDARQAEEVERHRARIAEDVAWREGGSA